MNTRVDLEMDTRGAAPKAMSDDSRRLFEELTTGRRCLHCNRDWDDPEVYMAPMLRDDIWAKLGDPTDLLCDDCFFHLVEDRNIHIGLAELRPCRLNLDLWFDHFFEGDESDAVMKPWYDVLLEYIPPFLHKDLAKHIIDILDHPGDV